MENYCIINTEDNVCDNIVVWDGDMETWSPPVNHIAVRQDATPIKTWKLSEDKTHFELAVSDGVGDIGFTWDGTYLITNLPQPEPVVQPTVDGAQTV